eukprot:6483229-Amphidinium_carterae.3
MRRWCCPELSSTDRKLERCGPCSRRSAASGDQCPRTSSQQQHSQNGDTVLKSSIFSIGVITSEPTQNFTTNAAAVREWHGTRCRS